MTTSARSRRQRATPLTRQQGFLLLAILFAEASVIALIVWLAS